MDGNKFIILNQPVFGFFFKEILLCKKLLWALHQENLNVQLLNDFLVLKELLPTLI